MIMLTGLNAGSGKGRPASCLLRRFRHESVPDDAGADALRTETSRRLRELDSSFDCSLQVCNADSLTGRLLVTRRPLAAGHRFDMACNDQPIDKWLDAADIPFQSGAQQLLLVAGLGESVSEKVHRDACIAVIRAIRTSVPQVYAQLIAWAPSMSAEVTT